jgi:hypothetical protein
MAAGTREPFRLVDVHRDYLRDATPHARSRLHDRGRWVRFGQLVQLLLHQLDSLPELPEFRQQLEQLAAPQFARRAFAERPDVLATLARRPSSWHRSYTQPAIVQASNTTTSGRSTCNTFRRYHRSLEIRWKRISPVPVSNTQTSLLNFPKSMARILAIAVSRHKV